jgi:putative peptide zinc metalloprotease protein
VRPRRTLALLLALIAGALAGVAPAPAQALGDTSAVAVNTKDGSTLFRLAFDIREITGDVVDQTNTAIAYSSCTQCRTIAISIQVLLVEGPATQFTPTNTAVAVNDRCTLCDSMALAYQFAVGGGNQELSFTRQGRREIAAINRELRTMPVEQLTDAEIAARVDALMDRLDGVLQTQLNTSPGRARERDRRRERAPPAAGGSPPGAAAPDQTPSDPTPTDTTPTDTTPTDTTPTDTTPAATSPAPAPPADATTTPTDTTQPAAPTTPAPAPDTTITTTPTTP